jgi:hypothetical protein
MFNDIYSVNLDVPIKVGRRKIKHFAVKSNVLSSEIFFSLPKNKGVRRLLCEMSDELRSLVIELNEVNRKG